jgi:hypothetical protein
MILTKALWPPFPRPYWPQCACSEVCETDGSRRLRCRACGQLAERALPKKLKVGEEACAAVDRAERLLAQLAVIGFRAELDAHGALLFVDATPGRRDFAKFCPAAYCFAVVNTALDIDPGFVPTAVSRPSEKRRIASAGRDRFVAEGWAEKARCHGWSERELFALPERWSRIDQCGVAWLIGERRVIEVTADAIAIETASGARLKFYRKAPQLMAELSKHTDALGRGLGEGGTLTSSRSQMPVRDPPNRFVRATPIEVDRTPTPSVKAS